MSYYAVHCKLGHSGTGQYRDIVFYICAKTAIDAMDKAKKMPGVKHQNRSAVLNLKQITQEEYIANRKESAYKNYKRGE